MDNRLNSQQQDALIEDALHSYPLESMPRDITAQVMARIQKDARPPIFTWKDGLVFLIVEVSLTVILFSAQTLPPIVLMKLHNQGALLYQSFIVNTRGLFPFFFLGLAICLSAWAIFCSQQARRL
jgi:hypothetical protein